MKRKITLSIALVLSVALLSLMSSNSTAKGQILIMESLEIGPVTLGPNQILRITVVNTDTNRNADIRFGQQSYTQGICNGGVCKLAAASQNTSAPITLAPGEAASFDISSAVFGVRGVVLRNSRDVQVNALIINTITGEITAYQGDVGEGTGI